MILGDGNKLRKQESAPTQHNGPPITSPSDSRICFLYFNIALLMKTQNNTSGIVLYFGVLSESSLFLKKN